MRQKVQINVFFLVLFLFIFFFFWSVPGRFGPHCDGVCDCSSDCVCRDSVSGDGACLCHKVWIFSQDLVLFFFCASQRFLVFFLWFFSVAKTFFLIFLILFFFRSSTFNLTTPPVSHSALQATLRMAHLLPLHHPLLLSPPFVSSTRLRNNYPKIQSKTIMSDKWKTFFTLTQCEYFIIFFALSLSTVFFVRECVFL